MSEYENPRVTSRVNVLRDLRIGEEQLKFLLRSVFWKDFGPEEILHLISDSGHEMDALGHAGDEGRRRPRKSTVSCQTSVDPCVSEWGNPAGVMSSNLKLCEVGLRSIR